MRRLTFASGKRIEAVTCGEADGVLVIKTGADAFPDSKSAMALLCDAAETSVIDCDYGSGIFKRFEGYTNTVYFSAMNGYMVSLRKPD